MAKSSSSGATRSMPNRRITARIAFALELLASDRSAAAYHIDVSTKRLIADAAGACACWKRTRPQALHLCPPRYPSLPMPPDRKPQRASPPAVSRPDRAPPAVLHTRPEIARDRWHAAGPLAGSRPRKPRATLRNPSPCSAPPLFPIRLAAHSPRALFHSHRHHRPG